VCAGLLVRSFRELERVDPGFDGDGVLAATLALPGARYDTPEKARAFFDELSARVQAVPGVERVALTLVPPLAGPSWTSDFVVAGRPPGEYGTEVMHGIVSTEYFRAMRVPVLRGRAFTAADRAGGTPVAVVTPGIAERLWPNRDPIGRQVTSNFLGEDQWLLVVGVVAEASSWAQPRGAQNEIYVPLAQQPGQVRQLVAVLRTERGAPAPERVLRARLRSLAPGVPARVSTLDERIARSAADRRFVAFALSAFGVVALLLAGAGIYGVMSYTVASRTREIGVRLALGATASGVRAHVLREAGAMSAAGIVAGVPFALLAARALRGQLYGVSPFDPGALTAGAVVLLLAALAGAYVPARRSSRADPLAALRQE
jgi:putative ABC transport system permease protein